jgi:hypothetical protein
MLEIDTMIEIGVLKNIILCFEVVSFFDKILIWRHRPCLPARFAGASARRAGRYRLGYPAHSFSADCQSDRGPGYVRDGYASLPRTQLPLDGLIV